MSPPQRSERRSFSIRELVPYSDPPRAERREQDTHRTLQAKWRRKFKSFRAEVELSAVIETSWGPIEVVGRVDGIRKSKRGWEIFEIKPVDKFTLDLDSTALDRAFWQLLLYGDLARESRQMVGANVDALSLVTVNAAGKARSLSVPYDASLQALRNRLETILKAELHASWQNELTVTRLESFIASDELLDRPDQRAAWNVLRTSTERCEFLALPPGAGKTRIALRWALWQAAQCDCPLIWITAKARGRETVLAELARYTQARISIDTVWKTSRARHCPDCVTEQDCALRRSTAYDLFFHGTPQAGAYCLHEQSAHAEPRAHLIIADLNYMLSPSSLTNRCAVYVVDEAQHWSARARDLAEAWLPLRELREACRAWPAHDRRRFTYILRPVDFDVRVSPLLWLEFFHKVGRPHAGSDGSTPRLAVVDGVHGWYVSPASIADVMRAGLTGAERILALSGSLPSSAAARKILFPPLDTFHVVESHGAAQTAICFVSLLDFRHPLTLSDHQTARAALRMIHEHCGGTLLVLGQNRESNLLLADLLRGSSLVCLDAADLGADWSLLHAVRPDILFAALGSSATESVNPPPELFSAAVVLAAGLRPRSIIDRLHSHSHDAEIVTNSDDQRERIVNNLEMAVHSVSRIVQAVGRLNRTLLDDKPVFMLNQHFLLEPFASLWPAHWRAASGELRVHSDLESALQNLPVVLLND